MLDRLRRSYLSDTASRRSEGLSPVNSERRVDSALGSAKTAIAKSRRSSIILAFSIATAVLLGAVAAWAAVCAGGRHRDGAPLPDWMARSMRSVVARKCYRRAKLQIKRPPLKSHQRRLCVGPPADTQKNNSRIRPIAPAEARNIETRGDVAWTGTFASRSDGYERHCGVAVFILL